MCLLLIFENLWALRWEAREQTYHVCNSNQYFNHELSFWTAVICMKEWFYLKLLPLFWLVSHGSMIGKLTGVTQADETFQAVAWSWGVPSIMPAGELQTHTQERSEVQWHIRVGWGGGVRGGSQEVVSQIPIECSTEAKGASAPLAVQLQVDPPSSTIIE